MDQQPSDTSFYFIRQLVQDQCRKDFDCLYQTYMTVMINLERRFNLPAAIYVGEEIVNITQQQGAPEAEAEVRQNRSVNRLIFRSPSRWPTK